jgi:hypothetical protein
MSLPKVLVSAPTANAKNYCFHAWIENVMQFSYPNFDVVLFDNSDNDNANFLNKTYKERYGNYNVKFNCIKSNVNHKMDIMQKLAISHNDSKNYCIEKNYDYLLHLETDIFPDNNVIEQLISHNKNIVGGLYYLREGIDRTLMVQKYDFRGYFLKKEEDCYFVDGNLKQVYHIGLGCVLLKKNILNKIDFRSIKNVFKAPDSYFAEDCKQKNIPIYADTSLICRHENKNWDKQILNKKYEFNTLLR